MKVYKNTMFSHRRRKSNFMKIVKNITSISPLFKRVEKKTDSFGNNEDVKTFSLNHSNYETQPLKKSQNLYSKTRED